MGRYFALACHTCESIWFPPDLKLSEIVLNDASAAALGRAVCGHPGCRLELVCDEDGGWDACKDYRRDQPVPPERGEGE